MAVRVKVAVRLGRKVAHVVAIANSGYEAGSAEILLPSSLAEKKLGVRAASRAHTTYVAIGGQRLDLQCLGEGKVCVLTPDRQSACVAAVILASKGETEVVMNDALVEALGISLLKVRHGIWRFSDDAPDVARQSEPPAHY